MKFEIINPSDPYTLETESFKAACVAVSLLGQGRYALRQLDAVEAPLEMPPFLWTDPNPWFVSQFGESADKCFADVKEFESVALAQCLESVSLPDGVERSSLTDIGERAADFARAVRKALQDGGL